VTVLDHSPRPTTGYSFRMQRRHEIVTTGGMEGVLRVGAALRSCGFPVRDFAVEVRDGVPYSSVTCTVSLTSAELEFFADLFACLDGVVSVDRW
jgi:hypothetical protein